jgi:hypothetical protein
MTIQRWGSRSNKEVVDFLSSYLRQVDRLEERRNTIQTELDEISKLPINDDKKCLGLQAHRAREAEGIPIGCGGGGQVPEGLLSANDSKRAMLLPGLTTRFRKETEI